jgi:transposase
MFINRRRDRIKIIWWDRDGLAIFMKRLESGTVQKPASAGKEKILVIDPTQLSMLLTGIDVSNIKRRKRRAWHWRNRSFLCVPLACQCFEVGWLEKNCLSIGVGLGSELPK